MDEDLPADSPFLPLKATPRLGYFFSVLTLGGLGFARLKRSHVVPLVFFILLVLVYNLNGRFVAGSDVYSTRFMPVNLALHGTYYFDPTKPYDLGTVVKDPQSPSNGRMISVYPTYTPTLLAPIYWLVYRLGGVRPESYWTFYLDKLFASLFVAGTGLLTFLLLRRMHGGREGLALLTAVSMALGTSLWAIASQGTWSHGPSAFFMILAAWALERAVRRTGDMRRGAFWGALAGWAIASAFVTRQSDIFFAAPFFFFAMWELRRSRAAQGFFLAGIAPVAIWFVTYNWSYFGHPLTTGYKYNMAMQRIPGLLQLKNFRAGFLGLLFSPSLGMFTMAPVTLFAVPGMITLFRRRHWLGLGLGLEHIPATHHASTTFIQRLMRIGTIFIICHVIFYSCYLEWWGGWSYCYRYLIDIQPFLALCVGWFFRPGAKYLKLRLPLFVPALVLSVLVQFYGAFFWCGVTFYEQVNKDQRAQLGRSLRQANAGIFEEPSTFFSLDRRKHIIFSELDYVHWNWSSWAEFKKPFATLDKIDKDLFKTKEVNFKPAPPIVLDYGRDG